MKKILIGGVFLLLILVSLGVVSWIKFFGPIRRLKDEDPKVRREAVESLAASWVPEPVARLTVALKDEDAQVREAAARALGRNGNKAALEPLIAALQDEDDRVRSAAASAMQHVLPVAGDPETNARAAEALVRYASKEREVAPDDAGGSVRMYAHGALLKIPNAGVEALVGKLQDDKVHVRTAAILTMGTLLPKVTDPEIRARAAEALIRALKDRDVRPYVLGTLLKIPNAAVEALISGSQEEGVAGVDSQTPEKTAERLIRVMAEREEVFHFAGMALGKIGPPAFEPLMAALQDEDARVRRSAALAMQHVLPTINDPATRARAVGPLLRAMKDPDDGVRSFAPIALAKIGEPALDSLLDAAVKDGEWEVRSFAALAAREMVGASKKPELARRVTERLIDQLQDERSSAAASALGQILSRVKDPALLQTATSALITALDDDGWGVRRQAASALGQILSDVQDDATVHTAALSLITTLEDDHEDVRAAAATALGQILCGSKDPKITKKAIKALLATPEDDAAVVRRAGASALGRTLSSGAEPELGRKAVHLLLVMVEDPNAKYGEDLEAANALAKIIAALKSRELAQTAVPILIEALQDERQPYRFRASLALGWIVSAIADPELAGTVVSPLITALQDKDESVREHAAESLGRIFSVSAEPELVQKAEQPLLAALEDTNGNVRLRAAWALVQIGTEQAEDAVRNAGFNPDQPPTPPTRDY